MKKYRKIILLSLIAIFMLVSGGFLFAFYCNYVVRRCSIYCYSHIDSLPANETGLVLGASKTSAFYAINPFIGSILSLIIFTEIPNINFIIAILIMSIATYFIIKE